MLLARIFSKMSMLVLTPLRYLLFLVVVISILAWAQQDSTSPADQLTLDAAVSLAMANNRQLKRTILEVEKAADEVAAMRTERLPHLNLTLFESELLTRLNFQFPAGTFGIFPGIGPVPARNTDISTPLRPTTYIFQTATQPLLAASSDRPGNSGSGSKRGVGSRGIAAATPNGG